MNPLTPTTTRFRGERYDLQPGRYALLGRCYGGSSPAVFLIAVVNEHDGRPMDWAAYIGAAYATTGAVAVADVAHNGSKLDPDDAVYFFPDVAAAVEYRL